MNAIWYELTEFRWVGEGPYAGYPGKDKLNEFGLYHLNRDDLRFQGNRRATDLALMTASGEEGLALVASAADIAVERAENQTLLSHNALIGGLGNKFNKPETTIEVDNLSQISGSFKIVPLSTEWPNALKRYFGEPCAARDVFRPSIIVTINNRRMALGRFKQKCGRYFRWRAELCDAVSSRCYGVAELRPPKNGYDFYSLWVQYPGATVSACKRKIRIRKDFVE